jgi:uncharacterized protein (DUF2141 family)
MCQTGPQGHEAPRATRRAQPDGFMSGLVAPALAAMGLGIALLLGGAVAQPALADSHGVKDCKAVNPTSGQNLTVHVTGLRNADGNVTIVLYGSNPGSFLAHGGRLARRRFPASTGAETCFAVPSTGFYAVAVYHHPGANPTNATGNQAMPRGEGRGYSNNPPVTATKPDFEQARVEVRPGSNSVTVNLQY